MSEKFDFDDDEIIEGRSFDEDEEEHDEDEDEWTLKEAFESDPNSSVRTTILEKNSMIGLLSIRSATDGAAICKVDPREAFPSLKVYDDPELARQWFAKAVRTSVERGWRVLYDGLPLEG